MYFAYNLFNYIITRVKDPRTILKELPLEDSLNLIHQVIPSNEVFLFKSRFENLERDRRLDIILPGRYKIERNQLQLNWLEQIDLFTNDEIQQIIVQSYLSLEPSLLLPKLQAASIRLHEWKSNFENIPESHLERPQTAQIINWINTVLPHDEKGIALLVGDAGVGKSVIMRDILHEIEAQGIPVLGIKADQYCVDSIEMLEKRLHLNEGIEAMIRALVQTNERVVLLIDQIDALSQSLSARREYLETFTRLVFLLSSIPSVRILISCRTYDLQNDHEFSFYRRQRKFQVGKLNEEEVKSILQKLSVEVHKLPVDLLELLKTPLHLDVFCRIYHPHLPFERIKILHHLYEEFWFQKVLEINTSTQNLLKPKKISTLIFKLARAMYDRQKLAVAANLFRTEYSSELGYLKSVGIAFESREGLAFFHQTFYDFVFAKQFVESRIPVEKYLLDNGQNLHIRSCLKMMLEFLRDSDIKEYLRVLQTILTSTAFYFHIKSLLLSLLGFVEDPTDEEMQLAHDFIFPEPTLSKAFISSVQSHKWLLFLLDEKQPQQLVKAAPEVSGVEMDSVEGERFSYQVNILNGLLLRHLPESRHEVLLFLSNLPEIEGKSWLIERILNGIGTWDNQLAFKLFDDYAVTFVDVFFAKFLENAAAYNLSWALERLKTTIAKAVESNSSNFGDVSFDYSLAELIAHFIENYPETIFDVLLDFQIQRLLLLDDRQKSLASNAIFKDFYLISVDLDDNQRNITELFYLLINCVRVLAKNRSPRFTRFVSESLDNQSATLLLILVEGFRANPLAMVAEIAHFFQIFIKKQGVDASDTLSWRARQLLKEVYSHFTDLQKRFMVQLVSQIESEDEKEWASENQKPEWVGEIRLKWLKCLPESDISQIPEVEQIFQDLTQRFPDLDDKEPNKIRVRRVGPPMEQDEYKNMTLEEWKESFNKYDRKYEPEWSSWKGGWEQHAQQFEAEVKKRPDFFYPLIEELIIQVGLPRTYLVHGLNGLKEAKFPPEQLLHIFKRLELTGFESWDIMRLVNLCGYFINEKIEDDFIVQFLVKMATTHLDPLDDSLNVKFENKEAQSIYASGFNTVRGSAVHSLPYLYYFEKHKNLIFETLEFIAEHDLLLVRCQMMPRLALLTNLDRDRSLHLFLRLIGDNEEAIMDHSAWSAQYLTRQNFEGMKPYFERALAYPKLCKDMAIILSLTWVFEREDALDLLYRFIEISEEAKAGAIEVAAHNMADRKGNPISRSIELFAQFLEESSEEVIQAYDLAFRYLKPADFQHIQPMLVSFSQTIVARKNPRPFYEYLITCSAAYPEACLELVENFSQYEKPDIRYSRYYDKEPIKVVINAYNELWGRKIKDHELLKKALLLFDKMLLHDRFRRGAETVLLEVER